MAKAINANFELSSAKKDLNTKKVKIKEIDKSLNKDDKEEKIFTEYKLLEQKKLDIDNKICSINLLEGVIKRFNEEITSLEINSTNEILKEDIDLKIIDGRYNRLKKIIIENLQTILKKIEDENILIAEDISSFSKHYEEKKEEYDLIFSKTERKKELKKEREKLMEELDKLDKRYKQLKKQADNLEDIKESRSKLLDELDELYLEYYKTRYDMYKHLTESSNNKLKLELSHSQNTSSFKSALTELLKGSNTRSAIINTICKNMSLRDFVEAVIERDTKRLKNMGDIDENNAEKIIEKLWSSESLTPVLALQHECYPEDVPSIQFKKPDGEYSPLKELSVGQKCTALLIIALSEGDRPVIIDQPEDALDITTVWEDVSTSLRDNKEKRQFILTTHNSSVAVASDSDNFIIVNSNADIANVKCKGAIDDKEVKSDVIKCLEGGEIPYLLRESKYNIK